MKHLIPNPLLIAERGEQYDSSTICCLTYDVERQELGIVFNSSPLQIYLYSAVPASVVNGLLTAESKGKYFNAEIRSSYSYLRQVLQGYVSQYDRYLPLEQLPVPGLLLPI
ncbi:KTSC domain-containing protein [Chroococcidiopsis sp.]|uniref:KTSC domain-containing protein n=1 Tax=Chroococcidiopsis sp. TaxID=3088168 RepID=UPI003F39710E